MMDANRSHAQPELLHEERRLAWYYDRKLAHEAPAALEPGCLSIQISIGSRAKERGQSLSYHIGKSGEN